LIVVSWREPLPEAPETLSDTADPPISEKPAFWLVVVLLELDLLSKKPMAHRFNRNTSTTTPAKIQTTGGTWLDFGAKE